MFKRIELLGECAERMETKFETLGKVLLLLPLYNFLVILVLDTNGKTLIFGSKRTTYC